MNQCCAVIYITPPEFGKQQEILVHLLGPRANFEDAARYAQTPVPS